MSPPQDLNWLLSRIHRAFPAVAHPTVVPTSGSPLACPDACQPARWPARRGGLTSLVHGAARPFDGGQAGRTPTLQPPTGSPGRAAWPASECVTGRHSQMTALSRHRVTGDCVTATSQRSLLS